MVLCLFVYVTGIAGIQFGDEKYKFLLWQVNHWRLLTQRLRREVDIMSADCSAANE
jgi:hypothetical protein